MQRATNPSPCAQPKSIVSVSNPGSSQNTINRLKIPSSIQERTFTLAKSGPGTGLRSGDFTAPGRFMSPWRAKSAPKASGGGGERGEHDALLLARVGAGVALAGAGPGRAADVIECDTLGDDAGEATGHHLPAAHVARLLLNPDDLLQVRVGGDHVLQLLVGE